MEAKGLTADWNDLSPGDKQAWLLDQALGRKRGNPDHAAAR